ILANDGATITGNQNSGAAITTVAKDLSNTDDEMSGAAKVSGAAVFDCHACHRHFSSDRARNRHCRDTGHLSPTTAAVPAHCHSFAPSSVRGIGDTDAGCDPLPHAFTKLTLSPPESTPTLKPVCSNCPKRFFTSSQALSQLCT